MGMTRVGKVGVVTLALVLASAATAFAYWTGLGSGTGTAVTGDVAPITVVQTSSVTGMVPGVPAAVALSGVFNNPNQSPVYVTKVTASISSVDKAASALTGTCDATDYTLSNAVMTVEADVPVGDAQGAWTGAKIQFNNTAANQNACKGATVHLTYSIS